MARSWTKIAKAIRDIVNEFGPLWPKSTKLAGYSDKGPYHCGNCEYLKKDGPGPFRDINGRGRCNQSLVLLDPEMDKDNQGLAIVNIENGCCEFVEPED